MSSITGRLRRYVCLLVGCLTSQQHASVSQGRICSDNFMCCHTEIQVADPTFYLTQSQYTDTGPISPSADPMTPGRVATGVPILKSLVRLDPEKIPAQAGFEAGIFRSRGGGKVGCAEQGIHCRHVSAEGKPANCANDCQARCQPNGVWI